MRWRKTDSSLQPLVERAYRYALALTHDPGEAEEVLQDAWLAIVETDDTRHLGRLLRQVRARYFRGHPRDALVVLESSTEDDEMPDLDHLRLDAALSLEKTLTALRAEEREALYLMAVEGYDAERIAELQERPVATVSALVARACQKLRAAARLGSSRTRP